MQRIGGRRLRADPSSGQTGNRLSVTSWQIGHQYCRAAGGCVLVSLAKPCVVPIVIESSLRIFAITAIAVPILYLLYCLVAGRRVPVDPPRLVLTMATAFLVMSIMEAGLGYLHSLVFGWRMWEYRLWPNHRDFGTYLGPITWPWYGFHFHLFNKALELRHRAVRNPVLHGAMTGLDGPLLEILGNGLYLLVFGGYVFYYFPPELGHLTSLFVIPYYAIAGVVLAIVMQGLEGTTRRLPVATAIYLLGLGFVFVG